MTLTTTKTLADYMAAHGYTEPRIGNVWIIDRWCAIATATGQPPTFARIQSLRDQGVWRIEIRFAQGGAGADFSVNELLPRWSASPRMAKS